MRSLFYEVPEGDPLAMADAVVGTCLVAVEIDGVPALALAAGGTDLSWEICEAYVLCGYLPPACFVAARGVADRHASPGDRMVLEACARSLRLQVQSASMALAAVEERIAGLDEEAQE